MAAAQTLTKGISFRRQGSSGVTWAHTWIATENGVPAVERPRVLTTKPGLGAQPQFLDARHAASGTSALFPDNSVRDAPPPVNINAKTDIPNNSVRDATPAVNSSAKTSVRDKKGFRSRFIRWLKRAFRKWRTQSGAGGILPAL